MSIIDKGSKQTASMQRLTSQPREDALTRRSQL